MPQSNGVHVARFKALNKNVSAGREAAYPFTSSLGLQIADDASLVRAVVQEHPAGVEVRRRGKRPNVTQRMARTGSFHQDDLCPKVGE